MLYKIGGGDWHSVYYTGGKLLPDNYMPPGMKAAVGPETSRPQELLLNSAPKLAIPALPFTVKSLPNPLEKLLTEQQIYVHDAKRLLQGVLS